MRILIFLTHLGPKVRIVYGEIRLFGERSRQDCVVQCQRPHGEGDWPNDGEQLSKDAKAPVSSRRFTPWLLSPSRSLTIGRWPLCSKVLSRRFVPRPRPPTWLSLASTPRWQPKLPGRLGGGEFSFHGLQRTEEGGNGQGISQTIVFATNGNCRRPHSPQRSEMIDSMGFPKFL